MADQPASNRPLVSIVMPVRTGAAFLGEALGSLLAQTLRDFELIIIDDHADAECRGIIAAAAAEDQRIRVLPAAGRGIADALNQGLQAARSPLIARMDGDDVALPQRLEQQYTALVAAPALAVLGSNYRPLGGEPVTLPATPAAIRHALQSCNPICHPSVMMRADAVRAVGAYRRALIGCEDFDLWLRLSERHDLANLQEPLLLYRHHGDQATWQNLEARLLSEVALFRSAALRAQGLPDLLLSGDPVTADMLQDSGLSPAALRRAIRARAFEAATHALNAGERQRAAQALAIARRHGALGGVDAVTWCRLTAKRSMTWIAVS